jgi:hypothetical protein
VNISLDDTNGVVQRGKKELKEKFVGGRLEGRIITKVTSKLTNANDYFVSKHSNVFATGQTPQQVIDGACKCSERIISF